MTHSRDGESDRVEVQVGTGSFTQISTEPRHYSSTNDGVEQTQTFRCTAGSTVTLRFRSDIDEAVYNEYWGFCSVTLIDASHATLSVETAFAGDYEYPADPQGHRDQFRHSATKCSPQPLCPAGTYISADSHRSGEAFSILFSRALL